MRRPVATPRRPRVTPGIADSLPAPIPTGGWNTRDALSAMPATDLIRAINCIVRSNEVRMRPGWTAWAEGIPPVQSVFGYLPPTAGGKKLFAGTPTGIYDITTVSSPTAVSAVTSLKGRWKTVNFPNSAGHYLFGVNGQDSLVRYDGSSWTTVSTLGSVNTSELTSIALFKQRLFFTRTGSASFWYLPAGAITGTLSEFMVGQLLRRGGYLVAAVTWSTDAGVTLEDRIAFISSEGEVVVFAGSDPASPSTWTLSALYYAGKPMGTSPMIKYGGDVLILTQFGVISLERLSARGADDPNTTYSKKISPTMSEVTDRLVNAEAWDMVIVPGYPLLIVNIPENPAQQFVYHFESQAWSKYTGLAANCWFFGDQGLMFGHSDGVGLMEGASDNGVARQMELLLSYNYLGNPAKKKKASLIRPILMADGTFTYELGCAVDFEPVPGLYSSITVLTIVSQWGTALWGTAKWNGDFIPFREWRTLQQWPSRAVALAFSMTSASVTMAFTGMDYILEGANPQ